MTNPVVLTPVSSDVLTSGGVYGTLYVGAVAKLAIVGTTVLANRKIVIVNNNSDHTIAWGFDSDVSISTGPEIGPGETMRWAATEAVTIYLAARVSARIRIAEGA